MPHKPECRCSRCALYRKDNYRLPVPVSVKLKEEEREFSWYRLWNWIKSLFW